jgi:hypothetical protein
LWYDNFPVLWKIFHHLPFDKRDGENITMLTQTRNFPVLMMNEKLENDEIFEFQSELQKPHVEVPEWIKDISTSIGLKFSIENLNPHISASFSASFARTRSQGGKGVEILRLFVKKYVREQSPCTQRASTWFGREFWTQKGVAKFYTMCREAALDTKFNYFLSSSFRTWDAPGTLGDAQINGIFSEGKLEEPIFGLDREFPPQLHQLCIEECISEGYLGNLPPYFEADALANMETLIGNKPIPARAHCVSEPGGKRRWITMEPSYVNMACQPLAHILAGLLTQRPTLYSAFNRSWKAWDLADAMSMRGIENKMANWAVWVYDLTSASNNLDRYVNKAAIEYLLSSVFGGTLIYVYAKIIISLLFRDRFITIYKDETPNSGILHTFTATNGLLMGNAATKEILVLCSEIVQIRALRILKHTVHHKVLWLIAGDDVGGYGPRRYFEMVKQIHRSLGNVIKDEKTFSSKIWVPFCQGSLFIQGIKLFHSKRLMKLNYDENCCTDTIMSRLLVPFGLESLEANPTAKNPVIGKGAALKKVLDYYPRKEKIDMVISIFHRNMGSLLSRDPFTFLPSSIGGYDCPHNIPMTELLERIETLVPNVFYPLFGQLTKRERTPIWVSMLLRRARTGISSRGIENPTLDPLIQSYEYALTECAQVKHYTWSELEQRVMDLYIDQGRNPLDIHPRDIRKMAKKMDLMNGFDFADILDRSSALRIFFLVAMDEIPLSTAIPRRGRMSSPSEILKDFASHELRERIKYDYITTLSSQFTDQAVLEGYKAFKVWFNGGMGKIDTDFGNRYLPRTSYTDSLNGMSVPIWKPRKDDEPYIKGSFRDPFRDLDQDLFIGRVITLDRVG